MDRAIAVDVDRLRELFAGVTILSGFEVVDETRARCDRIVRQAAQLQPQLQAVLEAAVAVFNVLNGGETLSEAELLEFERYPMMSRSGLPDAALLDEAKRRAVEALDAVEAALQPSS